MDEFGGDFSEVVDVTDDAGDALTDVPEMDVDLDSMSLDDLYALRDELTDTGDNGDTPNDYSFHWDGSPTHNVEWDDEPENPVRILKR